MSENKYLDSSGLIRLVANLINKFPTKTEIDTQIAELQSSIDSIDDAVDNIESGEIIVKEAEHAVSADSATNAVNAVNAENAKNSENAEKADYATEAGNANYATNAGTAANATSATFATQDASGNVITSTYETKTDAASKLAEAKKYTDEEIADVNEIIDTKADIADFNESIIGLSVNGTTVTYVKGDGSVHSFETQDTDTTYSLGTDETTGLTKLYATIGSSEDGTMTQKAIKTELDKKVGVTIDGSQNTLVFTK